MDAQGLEQLRVQLEDTVRLGWAERDPEATISTVLRDGDKIDMTVVSREFAGLDGREREASFWPVFNPVPKYDLVYMTCCLLLTPEEASLPRPSMHRASNSDDWA